MRRRIFVTVIAVVLPFILLLGCSALTGQAGKPSHEILRGTVIGTDWQVYQIKLTLPSGTEFPVLLNLTDGDKADGYFYLEKGNNVDFRINADSPVYQSAKPPSGNVSSDRFSFVASKGQGSTYSLQFSNPANSKEQAVIFLEVIYPVKGSIFIPLETKNPQTP